MEIVVGAVTVTRNRPFESGGMMTGPDRVMPVAVRTVSAKAVWLRIVRMKDWLVALFVRAAMMAAAVSKVSEKADVEPVRVMMPPATAAAVSVPAPTV